MIEICSAPDQRIAEHHRLSFREPRPGLNCGDDNHNLQNKDGIIAYQCFTWQVKVKNYDPEYLYNDTPQTLKKGTWSYGYYNLNGPLTSFSIENCSVKIVDGNSTIYRGCNHYSGQWDIQGSSLPLASFLPQPVSGRPPLRVGFWDQSFGVQSWAWIFGDGQVDMTYRSVAHLYPKSGVYQAKQLIVGYIGAEAVTKNIWVGNSLVGMEWLLLQN